MIGRRYIVRDGVLKGRTFTVRASKSNQMGMMRMYVDHPDDDGQSDCGPVDAAFLARCEPLDEEKPVSKGSNATINSAYSTVNICMDEIKKMRKNLDIMEDGLRKQKEDLQRFIDQGRGEDE